MIVSLIAAMSENRIIGLKQGLPWHVPLDLKRFRKITSGHPVIMGRKTFESINSRPLPNRTNVIITRQKDYVASGVTVVADLDSALKTFEGTDVEVFILGGGEIYTLALPKADRLYLTKIHRVIEGDTYFPKVDFSQFRLFFKEDHAGDPAFSFEDYERLARS